MKEEFNAALSEALEEIGRHTTPEQLRKRGVRRVLSVTRQDVSRLIEVAVNRTLLERSATLWCAAAATSPDLPARGRGPARMIRSCACCAGS